jgi:hypothetical protein
MLNNISWSQFLSSIISLVIVYYIAIIILYYRKDVLKWSTHGVFISRFNKDSAAIPTELPLRQKESTTHPLQAPRPMSYNEFTVGEDEHNNSNGKINYAEVHELMEDLKTIFVSSAKKKIIKQELILAIQHKLQDYHQLKGTEIENEIAQHIKNECKEKCALDLAKSELENLWKL